MEDEKAKAKLEALRAALIEGEESGPGMPFDVEEFIASMRTRNRPSASGVSVRSEPSTASPAEAREREEPGS